MLHRKIGRRIVSGGVLLAIFAAMVALAGSASASSRAAKKSSQTNVPINVGIGTQAVNLMPFYVAESQGFFARAGLKVSTESIIGNNPAIVAAMRNGELNATIAGSTFPLIYMDEGVIARGAFKLFAEFTGNAYDVVASKSIHKLSQLKGKTISISSPDGDDEIYLESVFKHYHIPFSSVTTVISGGTTSRLAALAAGAAQGIVESAALRQTSKQVGNVLLTSNKSPIGYINTAMIGTTSLLKHKAEVTKFVKATVAATKWIRSHRVASVGICEHYISATAASCTSGLAAELSGQAGGRWTFSKTEAVNEAAVASSIKSMASLLPKHRKLTVSDLVDEVLADRP